MQFTSESAFVEHVRSVSVVQHNQDFEGRRGGARRLKARMIQADEAGKLAGVAWRNKDRSRDEIIQEMKNEYGWWEWIWMGWQLYQLILQIVALLKPKPAP